MGLSKDSLLEEKDSKMLPLPEAWKNYKTSSLRAIHLRLAKKTPVVDWPKVLKDGAVSQLFCKIITRDMNEGYAWTKCIF